MDKRPASLGSLRLGSLRRPAGVAGRWVAQVLAGAPFAAAPQTPWAASAIFDPMHAFPAAGPLDGGLSVHLFSR